MEYNEKVDALPRFVQDGVSQCWRCKHSDGYGVHQMDDGHLFRFPYCKACNADMTAIYSTPCPNFEKQEG